MTAAMRSHPAVEKYTHKIDAFMQKYPSVSFYGAFDGLKERNVLDEETTRMVTRMNFDQMRVCLY
jgi:hypothetical protein